MIVPMKRLTLIALQHDEDKIMRALQDLCAVEIISPPQEADNGAFEELFSSLEERQRAFREAEVLVRPYAEKPSLLSGTPQTTKAELLSKDAAKESQALLEKIQTVSTTIADYDTKINALNSSILMLTPWSLCGINIENIRPTAHTRMLLGFVAPNKLNDLENLSASVTVIEENKLLSVMLVCHKLDFEEVSTAAREVGLVEFTFPAGMTGLVKSNLSRLTKQLLELREARDKAKESFAALAQDKEKLLFASDAVGVELERTRARSELLISKAAFMLDGWVREDKEQIVSEAISKVCEAYYLEFFEPKEGEVMPSCVENSKFVKPFESITNMYSRPEPSGIDATPFMAPFYLLFFGMMMSDTGYGLILYVIGKLFMKFKKPKGAFAGIVQVVTWGGLSTMICGPLIGTFFGMSWNTVFGLGAEGPFPLLFDPIKDSMSLLILCCGIGVAQMLFGLGIKAYMCVKKGDTASAIYDCASWIFLIIGIIGFAVLPIKAPFIALAMIGALLILLFAGRAKKGFGRVTGGFGALYNITGYLSDAVSYSRIFAMGLVTGAMGDVFNMLGSMLGSVGVGVVGKILTMTLAAAVLVVLHGFSLFINTLGSFAHTARLQYVEFYGKFYELGGREFKPLGYNTKYVNVK